MSTDIEELLRDADFVQIISDEMARADVLDVYREMALSPALTRVRADVDEPASYRVLALRLSVMGAARSLARNRMLAMAENNLPLVEPQQRNRLWMEMTRAVDSCERVLESTDSRDILVLVSENADAISHCIGTMSSVLAPRFKDLAGELGLLSVRASGIAANVAGLASRYKKAYAQVIAELAKTGPRMGMDEAEQANASVSRATRGDDIRPKPPGMH